MQKQALYTNPSVIIFFYLLIYFVSLTIMFYLWKFFLKILNKLRMDTPSLIQKDLSDLNQRITSSVNEDVGPAAGFGTTIFGFALNQKKRRSFPLADAREIEYELTLILNRINRCKSKPVEFIIIFDELDKIDPFSNYETVDDPDTLPEFEHMGSGFPGGAASRKRKHNLLKMLANMKFFVTTAKTKFIFIAGRELYDAFLADFSDREFAIGSIFNNVIYVDSFLSSNLSHKDISYMTEQFICKQLLPKPIDRWSTIRMLDRFRIFVVKKLNNIIKIKKIDELEQDHDFIQLLKNAGIQTEDPDVYYTFKTYYKYLKYKSVESNELTEQDINKTIIFLYQFSIYLAHISNGAPKKIAIHFEKYIRKLETPLSGNELEESLMLPQMKGESKYYLSFGYRDQQKIGFIHYMAFPLVNAIINNATQYGDKLLVSACFLTNHIYKYHNNGFSWRNLENIPELLDVNKTPELREFIHIIISYLKQSHLSFTTSGLYNFKFPMKITEEISMMSRFSEEVSALFNFTLDDSLSVKRHYSKLLKHYTSINNTLCVDNENSQNDLHHVIAGIHQILGDLHHFDEEYNEAIFEYQCCIQALTKNNVDKHNPHFPSHMLNLIRIMLKLGLTHEKRKTYNTAYVVYNELISMLVQFRYFDESKFGMKYVQKIKDKTSADIESDTNWNTKKNMLYYKKYDNYPVEKFEKIIHPKVVTEDEYDRINLDYEVNAQDVIPRFARQLTPEKNNVIVRLSMFEDIRLVYQALLAKLFLLEKKGLNGITKESLDVMEAEFNYLHRSVHYKDKFIISADFFRKVADILYYKNGFINEQTANNYFMGWYLWDYSVENDIYNYCSMNTFKDYEVLKKLMKMKYNSKTKSYELKMNESEALKPEERLGEINDLTENDIDTIKKFIKEKNVRIPFRLDFDFREQVDLDTKGIITLPQDCDYGKIDKCNQRRRTLLKGMDADSKNKRVPCYACKYYNRSLKILLENLIGTSETEHNVSKSLLYLEAIEHRHKFASLKENDMIILASSLDGLGNVLLSCSYKDDKITPEFLDAFVDYVKAKESKEAESITHLYKLKEMSHLEKSILYFWAAASYFKYSSNTKEAFFCYKKILQILVAYVSVSINKDIKATQADDILDVFNTYRLKKIKAVIFERAIQNLYSHYENTNMVEIQKIKWLLSKQMYEKIPLNLLSIFPDLEELVLAFGELELFCNEYGNVHEIYRSTFLSKNRLVNTFTERILSLRLKAMINMKIINQLIEYEDYFYTDDFPLEFYKKFVSYLNIPLEGEIAGRLGIENPGQSAEETKYLSHKLGAYGKCLDNNLIENKKDIRDKLDLIEFLIKDTMFSLSKIIETVSPSTKTTLFTESYLGAVYHLLFECNQIYELIYMTYKWTEIENRTADGAKEQQEIVGKIIKLAGASNSSIEGDVKSLLIAMNTNEGLKRVIKTGSDDKTSSSGQFFTMIFENIDKANIHINISNYLAEMALKKYRRAREMHREGAAYRDMISNIHFLDEDLNNDTSQFYFAIERYFNNCSVIDQNIKKLKDICTESSILDIENYINVAAYDV